MERYRITPSSSPANRVYIPHHLQSVPAEAKLEELFSTTARSYLQSGTHISSSEGLCHEVMAANVTRMARSITGDRSGISSENASLKLGAWDDVDHRRNGSKEVMGTDAGNDGGDVDEEGKSGVIGGKKKGAKKVRRPRFAFHTRSQIDILDDGYRWRKYGQKAVKNNNFPRSYYRCTHQGCNVKKQVQRLSKDEEVVVTTYEGTHTHPIERNNDNFEQILNQMQIYTSF